MKKITLGNETDTKALAKQCSIHSVSNAKRPFCPKCKAGAYYIWQYLPKYTCCFCGTTWANER